MFTKMLNTLILCLCFMLLQHCSLESFEPHSFERDSCERELPVANPASDPVTNYISTYHAFIGEFDGITQEKPLYIDMMNFLYQVDESYRLLIQLNGYPLYVGPFKQYIEGRQPLFHGDQRAKMVIIPPDEMGPEFAVFYKKVAITWDQDFPYLYIVFMPCGADSNVDFTFIPYMRKLYP